MEDTSARNKTYLYSRMKIKHGTDLSVIREMLIKESETHKVITMLQGSESSRTLLCAPVPGIDEMDRNLPWVGPVASEFIKWFTPHFGPIDPYFLVVPCTLDGNPPKKVNTAIVMKIIDMLIAGDQIERVVIIGSDPFKHYFGYGKKPSMPSLAGNILYSPRSLYKPLFVFPDLHALHFSLDWRNKFKEKREFYIRMEAYKKLHKWLEKITPKFEEFLKTKKQ